MARSTDETLGPRAFLLNIADYAGTLSLARAFEVPEEADPWPYPGREALKVPVARPHLFINPDLTVEAAAKEAGVEITGYARVMVGEGVEKKEEDFAAEVAKMVQG